MPILIGHPNDSPKPESLDGASWAPAVQCPPVTGGLTEFARRYRVKLGFFVVAGLLAFAWHREMRPWPLLDPSDPVPFAGMLLVVAGALLRSWAAGILHKGTALAAIGPYALARHPLYAGSVAIGIGFCLALKDPVTLAGLSALFVVLYLPRIRQEERNLSERFGGEWQAFSRRTGLFYPKGIPDRLGAPWSLSQWLHNREYNALLTCAALLAALHWLATHP